MTVSIQPAYELNNRAKHALIQQLGAVDAFRFLNQLRAGSGNYTADRESLFHGESVKSLASAIRSQRNEKHEDTHL